MERSVSTETHNRCVRLLKEKLEELREMRKEMWDARLDSLVAKIDGQIELVKELLADLDKPAS